jgi:3'-5' exoribonuclease
MELQVLEPGRTVAGAVCLRRKTAGTTKDGKAYLSIEVGNRTGSVSARIWSESVGAWDNIDVGAPVHVSGSLKAGWKGGPPELVVGRVEPLPRPHEIELEMNPICPVPLPDLRERFAHLLAHMSPAGEAFVRVVLEDVGEDDWWTAPAARVMHHACVHGLAWHSIEVAEIALALARSTPAAIHVRWDALLVGALLHDVAKVREYRWRGVPIDLSLEARLTYHTANGAALTTLAVERSRERLAAVGVTQVDVAHLCHVQLSHHGVPEYGSPVEPRTLEAMLIHQADNASAKLRGMLDDLAASPPRCGRLGYAKRVGPQASALARGRAAATTARGSRPPERERGGLRCAHERPRRDVARRTGPGIDTMCRRATQPPQRVSAPARGEGNRPLVY